MKRLRTAHYAFTDIEATLFRAGPEAYFTMLAGILDRELEARGVERPFEYRCGPLRCDGLDAHEMIASEIRA